MRDTPETVSLQYTGGLPASLQAPYFTLPGSFIWATGPGNTAVKNLTGTFINGSFSLAGTAAGLTSLIWGIGGFLGSSVNFTGSTALTSLSLPSCQAFIGGPTFTLPALTSLNVPNILIAGAAITVSGCTLLPVCIFPSLQYASGINALAISNCPALVTAGFPSLIFCNGAISLQTGNGAIANLTLGTPGTLKQINGSVTLTGQALTAASVNAVLALLVSLDGTNGTTLWGSGLTLNVSGGTSAAPSGQGVTDKATLVARGATITTN